MNDDELPLILMLSCNMALAYGVNITYIRYKTGQRNSSVVRTPGLW